MHISWNHVSCDIGLPPSNFLTFAHFKQLVEIWKFSYLQKWCLPLISWNLCSSVFLFFFNIILHETQGFRWTLLLLIHRHKRQPLLYLKLNCFAHICQSMISLLNTTIHVLFLNLSENVRNPLWCPKPDPKLNWWSTVVLQSLQSPCLCLWTTFRLMLVWKCYISSIQQPAVSSFPQTVRVVPWGNLHTNSPINQIQPRQNISFFLTLCTQTAKVGFLQK